MTIGIGPPCLQCAHFESHYQEQFADVLDNICCLAFPKGIPDSIFLDHVLHDKHWKGQEGTYVFKKAK